MVTVSVQIAVDRLNRRNKFDQLSRQCKYNNFTPYSFLFVHRGRSMQKGCGELGFPIARTIMVNDDTDFDCRPR